MQQRVLVIEDDTADARLATIALNGGYDCTVVSMILEADAALRSSQFDLIITDLSLPDAPAGAEPAVVAHLRAKAHRETAIVVYTGADLPAAITASLVVAGANSIVVKRHPDNGQLRSAAAAAVAHRRAELQREAEIRQAERSLLGEQLEEMGAATRENTGVVRGHSELLTTTAKEVAATVANAMEEAHGMTGGLKEEVAEMRTALAEMGTALAEIRDVLTRPSWPARAASWLWNSALQSSPTVWGRLLAVVAFVATGIAAVIPWFQPVAEYLNTLREVEQAP
ncbi:MAG: response regulator [Planctomycetota bacterium]